MAYKNFVVSLGYAQYLETHSLNKPNFGKAMLPNLSMKLWQIQLREPKSLLLTKVCLQIHRLLMYQHVLMYHGTHVDG